MGDIKIEFGKCQSQSEEATSGDGVVWLKWGVNGTGIGVNLEPGVREVKAKLAVKIFFKNVRRSDEPLSRIFINQGASVSECVQQPSHSRKNQEVKHLGIAFKGQCLPLSE